MDKIKIGWSEVDLTPVGKKVSLAGQFYERISDQIETPIVVTAMAIECGGDSAIFCACDLVSTSHKLLCAVRERLSETEGFPVDKVMISAIHTHTAPGYANRSDTPQGSSLNVLTECMPDAKYEKLVKYEGDDLLEGVEAFEFIADRIAKAAKEAWEARSEAQYAAAFGRAAVGMCRRVCYEDGSAKMWGDTNQDDFKELEAGNDSGIEIIFTFDKDKNLTGVIGNIACPAQVLEHRNFISSDYWGKVKRILREKYGKGIFLLPLCAAAGDQCPRDMIRWVEPETPINDPNIVRENVVKRGADPSMFDVKGCELVARRIANEIFYAFEDVEEYVSEAEFAHKSLTVSLPVRRVTDEEAEFALGKIMEFAKENGSKTINFKDNARMHIYGGTVMRSRLQKTLKDIDIEVHVIRLGNIAFATNPFELFLNYGNKIRARSKASQTFLVQLSCGAFGYLPTEKAEKGSHYSAYVSSGITGHEGGEKLVETTLSEIEALWK